MREKDPHKSDDGSDKKRLAKTGKSRKGTKALGNFAVKPKQSETVIAPETADDLWQKLSLTKRRHGRSETPVPLAALEAMPAAAVAEVSETEAAAEELSESERRYAAREIVTAVQQQQDAQESAISPEAEEAVVAAREAVAFFRDKIVSEDLEVEQAFAETLQSFVADPEIAGSKDKEVAAKITENFTYLYGSNRPAETSNPFFNIDEAESSTPPAAAPGAVGGGPSRPMGLTQAGYSSPRPKQNAATTAPVSKEYVPYYNKEDMTGAALIGGIIGYLIGRRRGRIKTEKKLWPVRKKLEKQVKDLQEDIQRKEVYIRKAVRQQREDRQKIAAMERDKPTTDPEPTRQIAPEANQLHGKKVAPERIGHVLMTAEDQTRSQTIPNGAEKISNSLTADSKVETMSRAELLDLSEKVKIENTTLRRVYDTHLVGEQGLRRLVGEYTRGGDVQKVLRQELVEHEIDFERDPILRNRRQTPGDTNGETLSEMLKKVDVLPDTGTKDELAVLNARQAHQETRHVYQQKHRRVMDISIVTAILILFALVVTLLITGR